MFFQCMKMNAKILCFFCAVMTATWVRAEGTNGPATLAQLRQHLNDIVSQPKYAAALWGVKVASLDSGKTLFEHNAEKLCSPASNSKLYTVALALNRLGPDYRIKTSLYANAKPDDSGVLKGDLIVYGRGDPTINARLNGGNLYKALGPLIAALTNAGVKSIEGDIVGDDTFFRGMPYGSGWAWDDLENYYGAEISALTLNDNYLQVTVRPGESVGAPCTLSLSPATTWVTLSNRTETVAKGGRRRIELFRPLGENVMYVSGKMPLGEAPYSDDVTLHDPAGLFASFFRDALIRAGINVKGGSRSVTSLDVDGHPTNCGELVELGFVESLPMKDIAREVQKPSQNLYTDLLLAHVGEKSRTDSSRADETSEDLGLNELNKFLGEAGIKRGDTLFEEGSGLGRDNLTTPNATVALLEFMHTNKWYAAYYDSMPIAGVDGTIRNRMKGTPAAGNLHAKTGTLRWANSLSGYVTSAAGEHLVFSIMLNRFHNADTRTSSRNDLDAIGVLLASFSGKSTE